MNGHENDANGATPSADNSASGGGIFSTPDLTIESANIPANVGGTPVIDETASAPGSDNSSRIASAFANTDATSQLQDVNAAMQSRSNMTTSTATGDIKLAPSTKPKSKAPLIIVILLVLAGVGALVWAVVTGRLSFGGGSSDDTGSTVSLADAQKAYNRYATYLLFGESKDELEGEWNTAYNYKINREFSSSTVNTEYWETAIKLFDEAIFTYEKLPTPDEAVAFNMQKNRSYLQVVYNYYRLAHIVGSDNTLTKYFSEHGFDATKEYISNFAAADPGSEIVQKYNLAINKLSNSYPNELQNYLNAGCIKDETIDQECAESLTEDNLIEDEPVEDIDNAYYSAGQQAEQAKQLVIAGSWEIGGLISATDTPEAKETGNDNE